MERAIKQGTLIGILDINGKEIANGDELRVQHVNNMGTPKEWIDEEFSARVFYNRFNAMFMYRKEDLLKEEEESNDSYTFNHRSSRFEILRDGK